MAEDTAPPGDVAFPATAIVHPDGALEAVHGDAVAVVERSAELRRYALEFPGAAAPVVRFWWRDDATGGWRAVLLEDAAVHGADGSVAVQLVPGPLPYGLTARELDVLTLVACGLANDAIALRLETARRTVSTHVERILGKLGQPNRAAAAALAVEHGLLRLPLPGSTGWGDGPLAVARLAAGGDARAIPRRPPRRRPFAVGSLIPLGGPGMADGHEMLGGATLAIRELNARGGVGGRPLTHLVADVDIFEPDSIRDAFARLADAGVDAITCGYVFAEDVAREEAAAYGAPYLHAATSESQVRHVREAPSTYGNIFQVCPSETYYGPGFVAFLDGLARTGAWRPPNRRLLFLETPLPSGQMVTEQTLAAAERAGWQLETLGMPAVGADPDAVVDGLHRRAPAAVIVTQFLPGELARFQRRFAASPSEILVCAVYTPSVPEFLELAGERADGLIWATVSGTYSDPIGLAFHAAYRAANGRPPGRSHAGIAYDSVQLLAQAWAQVGNPRRFGRSRTRCGAPSTAA